MLWSEHNDKNEDIAYFINLGLAAEIIEEVSLSRIEFVLLRSLNSNLAYIS